MGTKPKLNGPLNEAQFLEFITARRLREFFSRNLLLFKYYFNFKKNLQVFNLIFH